jgi:ACS family tartrate transporter-like MFS transporter
MSGKEPDKSGPNIMTASFALTANRSVASDITPIERDTMRRIFRHILPILTLGYFCASLDRANVGMAATTMKTDLGLSNAQFGFGAGIFFFGYLVAEIPSNLVLNHVGARRWVSRILMTWGMVSALTAVVWNEWSLYGVRFLLGVAEAGFFPGVLLYITWWLPSRYRSRMTALVMAAGVFSQTVGPPMGGLLLRLQGVFGLAGWQWLFLVESLPTFAACLATWMLLTDRPAKASWLAPEQKTWLVQRLASEDMQREAIRKYSLHQALGNSKIWALTAAEFGHQVVGYGLVFFMPLIMRGLGVATRWVGVVTALPYLCGFLAMIAWGYHSDRTGERVWHAAGTCFLVAVGLVACLLVGAGHPIAMMLLICITVMANQSFAPCFWSIPGTMLTGAAAAGGLAMINSFGNLGGWLGPSLYGMVKDETGNTGIALFVLAIGPLISGIILLLVGHDQRLECIPTRSSTAE